MKGGLKLAVDLAASLAAAALKAVVPLVAAPKPKAPRKERARAAAPEKPPLATRSMPAASDRAGLHRCEHGARHYRIFKPGMTTAAPPLLVMLHGCGQTPADFAKGTGMNALAKTFGLIVVYPAQPREAHPTRCWNWFQTEDIRRDAGEAAILASLTRDLVRKHGADPARVYVAGLSAGASMALALARAYPELFAAVGVHSGLPAGAARDQASALVAMQRGDPGLRRMLPMPTIVFHGSHDRVVNPRNGRLVVLRAREPYPTLRGTETAGQVPNGRAYRRTVYRLGSGRSLVEHWNVAGSGHAWSGGSSRGRFTDERPGRLARDDPLFPAPQPVGAEKGRPGPHHSRRAGRAVARPGQLNGSSRLSQPVVPGRCR